MTAPIRQASAEVSPIEPGSRPTNDVHHDSGRSAKLPVICRICASAVAPEKPSTASSFGTAVHTWSPDIDAG